MANRVIGGEFDIDVRNLKGGSPFTDEGYFYSSGRAALFNILSYLEGHRKFDQILLPDYVCESVLEAVDCFTFSVQFYSVSANLSINTNDLFSKITDNSIVLVINYFGCIDLSSDISAIKNHNNNAIVIEDNVQAFFSMFNDNGAHFSFTSFRKAFAAPDGAWVKSIFKDLPPAVEPNTFAPYKIAGGILKNISKNDSSVEDKIYLDLLKRGEDKINDNYTAAISEASISIMSQQPFEDIAKQRKRNAQVLIEGLQSINLKPIVDISDYCVPLFVPIRVEQRNKVRAEFFNNNIFCPVHWPVPEGYELERGRELADSELSLIIDQRYNTNDMQRILTILQKFN